MLKASTLRPGLLVSLKTSQTGNTQYVKRTIEANHLTKDGKAKAKWETLRVISDPAEHERACQVRSKARATISGVCANSAFGLLCPESNADELEAAIVEARQLVEDFNSEAKLSRVHIYVVTGRIAPDDVEAVRAINSEVRELLDDMKEGIKNLDVKAVREAAGRARSIGMMLSPDAQARITVAIEAARKTARAMVKAGEQAAQEIDRRTLRTISESRTAFLDLDDEKEIADVKATARALDLAPESNVKSPRVKSRAIEME